MVPVIEVLPGVFERVVGNPVLLSLDGEVKAPLLTILAPSWTDEERAEFGVFMVEAFTIPEGKRAMGDPRYQKRGSAVVEVIDVEDIPAPKPDTRTPTEKVADFASSIGVTIDDMRAVLVGGKQ